MADPVPAIPAAEVTSVVFAAFMVWLSALVQHFGNVAKQGADYVVSDVISVDGAAELSHDTAWIYVLARLIFSFSYWLRVQVIRSLAWLIRMICCAIMYYVAVSTMILR